MSYIAEELEDYSRDALISIILELEEEIEEQEADCSTELQDCRDRMELMEEFLNEKGLLGEFVERFGEDI